LVGVGLLVLVVGGVLVVARLLLLLLLLSICAGGCPTSDRHGPEQEDPVHRVVGLGEVKECSSSL
jgi:hypothetical protein